MKFGIYIVTGCALAALVLSGHFATRSYFNARQLKAQSDQLTARTLIIKHQAGELEQKMRVLQRVAHFVNRAHEQRLTPDSWSVYEVNIQESVTFSELAQIVEQCVQDKDVYYKPLAFHVALNQEQGPKPPSADGIEPIILDADGQGDKPSDVALALKGTFLVRH